MLYLGILEIKVMKQFIKECIIGTAILAGGVMFLAAAVIAIYKAAGL